MEDNLLKQFKSNLNDPKSKEIIIRYLVENEDLDLVKTTERIFSNENTRLDFLNSIYSKEFTKISNKTPTRDVSALNSLKNLIENKDTNENDMKEYFQKYPWSISYSYRKIETQKRIGEQRILDYLLEKVNGGYDILEIKGPHDHMFNKKTKNLQFNQFFINGLFQLIDYIDYCDKHYDYILSAHNIDMNKTNGILLIDNKLNNNEKKKIKIFTSFINRITVRTYDEIYNSLENALMHTNKAI